MCGILAWFREGSHSVLSTVPITESIAHRGPDKTTDSQVSRYAHFTFHRLAINGLENGDQPFYSSDWTCMVNGEIYNHQAIERSRGLENVSGSDCEVYWRLLHLVSPVEAAMRLDGVYATVALHRRRKVIVSRDPFGVRSLFIGYSPLHGLIGVASEAKALVELCQVVLPVSPGQTWMLDLARGWGSLQKHRHHIGFANPRLYPPFFNTDEAAMAMIRTRLTDAVKKRMMVERFPIGCFLSGGLDSSLVASLVCRCVDDPKQIHTFSIGMEGSPDLKWANVCAEFLGTTHHEFVVAPDELLGAIPAAVHQMETWDTTTIRAGTPMYVLSKRIYETTPVRVIFSGEGSDELSGSYMYFKNCPNNDAFQAECVRLCHDLSFFDVLRCDKATAGNGLEVRVPFLDLDFARDYLRVDPELRKPRNGAEKYLLRKAFDDGTYLPKEVLWRTKEAFSDGVSQQDNSWHTLIQHHAQTGEKTWFKSLFNAYYPGQEDWIPYEWLPKWSGDVTDPSARVLDVYDA